MLPINSAAENERVLIHAPFGRDGTLIRGELRAAGFSGVVCGSVDELCSFIKEGAGVALVGDEALIPARIQRLATQLSDQPPWSDLPLLVMTSGGAATDASRYRLRLLEPFGNVALLERPLRPVTLVSSVRAALRARRHQYQLRDLLAELEENNKELKCTNEDLTRANAELEEFAYVASHDLQEPLRMVNIYTQLILNNVEGENHGELIRYREFVRQGITRMGALLADLLTFSRTIHAEDLQAGAADLSDSLKDAVSVLKDRIEESGAVINVGPLPEVRGDATQISHVFQNLIANSIKYRKTGEAPNICISAEPSGAQWVIAFTDNGIGFEQQYAERIFGLFKRLHKDEYPGTGLGLAICQRIVERYGGRIWASSKAGQGATFYFALPRVSAAAIECGRASTGK
jgi:signal transduction histidine kinase